MHSFEVESVSSDTLDVKVPANVYSGRSHHYGLAEEMAAIFSVKPKNIYPRIINAPENRGLLNIDIQEPDLCPRYSGRVFEIKKVGQSEKATKKYLKSCGINPINALVDAMNLAMILTGQPLHVFDYDALAGQKAKKIIVRKSKKGERLLTLDEKTYELPVGTLLIADTNGPLAIAGIKGGAGSGVTSKTKRILVEAANFNGAAIYRSVRAIGLPTDASNRFSHNLSPALVDLGLDCATILLKKMGARLLDSAAAGSFSAKQKKIILPLGAYKKLMGQGVVMSDATRILSALGFSVSPSVKKGEGEIAVLVPLWRDDISTPEDLIEEIARIRGYQNIPPEPPLVALSSHSLSESWAFAARMRTALVGYGLDEAILSSFISPDLAEAQNGTTFIFGQSSSLLRVVNPISQDRSVMRPSLIPGLMSAARANARFFENIGQFEIGKVFAEKEGLPQEKQSVAVVIMRKGDAKVFLEAKGIAEDFLRSMGVYDFLLVARGQEIFVESGAHTVGRILHLEPYRGFYAAAFEFDAEELRQLVKEEKEYAEIPRFPGTWRDVSLLLSATVPIGDVMNTAQSAGPDWLEDVDLIDEFSDEDKLGNGMRSLTLRFRFQAKDRTLSDAEVAQAMEKITEKLRAAYKVQIR